MVKAAKKQPAKKQAAKKAPRKTKKPEAKKKDTAAKQKKQTVTNQRILNELISLQEEQQKQDEVEVSDFEEESLEFEEEEEEEETVFNKKAEKDEESDQESMVIEIVREGFIIPDNEINLDCNKTVHILDTTLEIGYDLAWQLISKLRRKRLRVEFSFDDKNPDWRFEFNNIVICDYDSVEKYRYFFSQPPQGTTFLFRCKTDGEHTLYCNLPNLKNVYCLLDNITSEKVETLVDKFILRNKKEEVDDIPLKGKKGKKQEDSQSNASLFGSPLSHHSASRFESTKRESRSTLFLSVNQKFNNCIQLLEKIKKDTRVLEENIVELHKLHKYFPYLYL